VRLHNSIADKVLTSNIDCFNSDKSLVECMKSWSLNQFQFYVPVLRHHVNNFLLEFYVLFFFLMSASNIDCLNSDKILVECMKSWSSSLFQFYVPVFCHHVNNFLLGFYVLFFTDDCLLVPGEENCHTCYAWCGWKIRESKVSDCKL